MKTEPTVHTEHSMGRALYQHFWEQRWAPLAQVEADWSARPDARRTVAGLVETWRPGIIDMLMVRKARKRGLVGRIETLAVEIKVSRADFRSDVRRPEKQVAWRRLAHRHVYAVPAGMVRLEEVPAGSGLLEVVPGRAGYPLVRWARRAPYTETPGLSASLVLAFAYRAARADALARGFSAVTGPGTDMDPDTMRAELARLRGELEREERKRDRLVEQRDAWRALAAAGGGTVGCRACGRPVRPASLRSGDFTAWRHTDPGDDAACLPLRVRAAEDAARAEWAATSQESRRFWLDRPDPPPPGQEWRVLRSRDADPVEPADSGPSE